MSDPQPQPYRQEIQAVIDAFAGAAGTQNQLEAFIDLWIKATVFARSIRQIAGVSAAAIGPVRQRARDADGAHWHGFADSAESLPTEQGGRSGWWSINRRGVWRDVR